MGNDFLDVTPKHRQQIKNRQFGFLKLKSFCTAKKTFKIKRLGMVAFVYNPSTWEAWAEEL
jgi:hypothetical protein